MLTLKEDTMLGDARGRPERLGHQAASSTSERELSGGLG